MKPSQLGCRDQPRLEETGKIESKDGIETFANYTDDKYEPSKDLVNTDMESIKLNRNSNQWQKLKYNRSWMHIGARMKI